MQASSFKAVSPSLIQKAKLLSQKKIKSKEESPEELKVNQMALCYEAGMASFLNDPAYKMIEGRITRESQPHLFNAYKRCVKMADELNVTYRTFINAQFYFMNKWFKKPPTLNQIKTDKAKERAKQYIELGIEDKPVHGTLIPNPVIPQEQRNLHSQQQLFRLMKNFNATEETILLTFANTVPKAKLMFDINWLNNNPTYQKLKASGRVR